MKIDEEKIYQYSEIRPGKQKLSSNSLLYYLPILKAEDNTPFLNIFRESRLRELVKSDKVFYDIYNIKEGDRWDIISEKFYNTPNLWWIICYVNDIVDPEDSLQAGEELIILKSTFIYYILSEMEKMREW